MAQIIQNIIKCTPWSVRNLKSKSVSPPNQVNDMTAFEEMLNILTITIKASKNRIVCQEVTILILLLFLTVQISHSIA